MKSLIKGLYKELQELCISFGYQSRVGVWGILFWKIQKVFKNKSL